MITTASDFQALCDQLRDAGRFSYDTEFIGELSYFPKLCLVQVATETDVALIDPFHDEIDLTAFWSLVADPDIEKIVHAGEQDLEPVVRLLDREPANIFDTQIYAGFAALPYPTSLQRIVNELAGVKLGKALTFTHWDARPLSEVHQRYAADDVRYLHAVRAAIGDRLVDAQRASWAREECDGLCDRTLYVFDPDVRWRRVRGGRNLKPRQIEVLKQLVAVRDIAARDHDVPPRSMIRDEILVAMAKNPPKSIDKLNEVRGLPRPVEQAYGGAIIEAIHAGCEATIDPSPAASQAGESAAEKLEIDSLWGVVSAYCYGLGIDPALVGTRHDFASCYRTMRAGDALSDEKLGRGWRGALLHDVLRTFLEGQGHITLRWRNGRVHADVSETRSDSAPD